ncbi:MAG: hypothetical protein M0P47_03035 [Bacteroidales bacterium]|nr:hypothetical protein [Bacteroidales bacterium]
MSKSNRYDKFLELREQYPYFIFEAQEYSLTNAGLSICFTFNLADQITFHPTLFIPRKKCFLPDEKVSNSLDNIIFHIGMIELISYWKAACPPTLIIKPFALSPNQVEWWKNLYFHGLGEFFYLNSVPVNIDNFIHFKVASDTILPIQHFETNHEVLIPIGGGKDSAVTLQLLESFPGSLPMIMNPRGASLETIRLKGFSDDQYLKIIRTLDPALIGLNEKGFLNGHTPFSALLAFVTVLSAIMTGRRYIALSNESSANESTIEGTTINHQYSKSVTFENDFRKYLNSYLTRDINYFSFLRPLNELQIALLFSKFTIYHPVFKSCNAGSKTDSWCGACAKCLFTYIILSPFLSSAALIEIFGKNLLDDPNLSQIFDQLTGIAEEKPFDCVGTIREVNLALCETIRRYGREEMPCLLELYRKSSSFKMYSLLSFSQFLKTFPTGSNLSPEFETILKNELPG